jgi:hypothetical protein
MLAGADALKLGFVTRNHPRAGPFNAAHLHLQLNFDAALSPND